MKKLHLDIETFSSVALKSSGNYRYTESIDFEILLIAYSFDDGPIKLVDLASGDLFPRELDEALQDPNMIKCAHNATFERNSFRRYGYDIPISQWECSMTKAAYCGYPLSLQFLSEALGLEEKGKLTTGKQLIRYFCFPCKPTKANNFRGRNFPEHAPEKWEEFKTYCINDVEAEREVLRIFDSYELPKFEKELYILDQQINDRGIRIDRTMAENAYKIDEAHKSLLLEETRRITGLENPNSPSQLKEWLSNAIGSEIKSLAKELLPDILEKAEDGSVSEVIELRKKLSKTSTKKYVSMINCLADDGKAHGLFQFYGANKTGRWAGRLIQLQNLPQNHLKDLDLARSLVAKGDYETLKLMYDDIPSVLSELIRTAFIPDDGFTFAVADFSAIEARVIAWLAGEEWRMEVFRTHGKIYEASASRMFNVPIEQIHKGSELRFKGKVAELALGYQGSIGAMKQMGAEKMGLSEKEIRKIVKNWRQSNKAIVTLWAEVEECAMEAMQTKRTVIGPHRGLRYKYDGKVLRIQLPSKKCLFYPEPSFTVNRFGMKSIQYKGMDQKTNQWTNIETYGGKLVENLVQAISRDILADSMLRVDQEGYPIVMHVHDELIANVPIESAEIHLKNICDIMGQEIKWAKGLPLVADGYLTPFYKKD